MNPARSALSNPALRPRTAPSVAAGGLAGVWFATIDFVLLERDWTRGPVPAIGGFVAELVLAGALFGSVAWVVTSALRRTGSCDRDPRGRPGSDALRPLGGDSSGLGR